MKKSILLAAIVLLVAGTVAAWIYGRPAYRRYKENRSVTEAQAFMARADYRNASLSAREALIINSNNLEACALMADLSDRSRSPQVLEWRRRVAELAPTLQNRLMYASAGLRFQSKPYSIAAQTLEDLAGSAQSSPMYHAVAADLAMRLGHTSDAAAQFDAAAHLDPTNQLYPMNLSVLQLQSTNDRVASAARERLASMGGDPEFGVVALRWLVEDCLRRNDLAGADRYSRQLLPNSNAELADRLDRLNILQQTKNPEFNGYLRSLQSDAITNASATYTIASWMLGHDLAEDTQRWLTNCPARLRAEQPVPLALVDCYVARKDWLGLDTFLVGQQWHDLDFLRFAYLSRASEELQQEMAAEARWRSAVRATDNQLGSLTTLLNMARNWRRLQAEEDLLLQIGQYYRRERWASRDLERLYLATGDTAGLNKVYAMRAESDSTNYVAQNNLAATSLLLRTNLPHAFDLARQLYQSRPEDSVIATTYAYSLLLQNRARDGVEALEKLKPETLDQPPVALYYGVLLSAAGRADAAKKYLQLAQTVRILPEEKALVVEAGKGTPRGK
jgi:predicted Zn-dependent protease